MTDDVKPTRRRYDASGRRARAQQTREHVVAVATRLFERDGYAPTTIAGVAQEAGVSPETVYKTFGSKPLLLRAAINTAVRGDSGSTPLRRRAVIDQIRQEPDARRQLELYAAMLEEVQPRLAPLIGVMREAAPRHPEITAALEQLNRDRLDGMSELAAQLAARSVLRPGVDERQARDVLWTLNSPELYELLVVARGWSGPEYRRWITETLIAVLLW
jgi:AcrR family transcriptional regulator